MKRRSERGGEAAARPDGSQGKGLGGAAAGALQPAAGGLLAYLQKFKIKRLLLDLFILYASVPFVIRLFPSLLRKFVYLNFLSYPFGVDFQKPEVYLNHTVNFYLTPEPGVTYGVWHSLPDSRRKEAEGKDPSWHEEALADDNPVILYLHGNGGNRAMSHRVRMAKVMSDADFHVLAIDYRGYGDSTGDPSETGFTTDVLFLYHWVKARSGNSTVIVWGHSLGTGIATNVARALKEKEGVTVDAVILEAPFTNIREAAATIPVTKIYRKFPGFEYLILDTMARADMYFYSDRNVQVLSSPILMLHSEDDGIIPITHSRKLFEIARNTSQKKDAIRFLSFPASEGYGHDHLSSNPELPDIVKNFLQSIK
ncbi:PREDICTED: abhydrolase domain-containing protein 12B isoform X2 [Gekko japonicus]|uniref:Abhydrolase domain-containing protein 12B isoform X2 n=1 Tax=Gekko japonicus TaxID=146911 RepID=A0ABM1KQW1_GEKJA|nr:PREDICTED: abhydrolase domain-containing protein 12B isoform X2 [Gekko japonicus]